MRIDDQKRREDGCTPKASAKRNSICVDFARSAFTRESFRSWSVMRLRIAFIVDGVNTSYQPAESIARRLAVLARFAGADIDTLAVVHFDFDRLITAVAADVEADVMAALL